MKTKSKQNKKVSVKELKDRKKPQSKLFRFFKWVVLPAACLMLLAVLSMYFIYSYISVSTSERIFDIDYSEEGYDCILILGAKVYGNSPSAMLQDRLDTGAALYFNGVAKKIIVSGDHGQIEYDEVNAMKKYLMGLGIPDSDIFMDHAGFCTYDSVYRASYIFGVKKMVIVTQNFHLPRAMFIADMYGIECVGVSADRNTYYGVAYNYLREVPARIKDFVMVFFSARPTYLGEKIDIDSDGSLTNDGLTNIDLIPNGSIK